jgi:hypothetical protein
LVRGRRVCGSLKTCSVAMREKTNVITRAGTSNGSLIRRAICSSLQPSTLAASYSSGGIARSPVYSTIMLKPTPPHTAMLATEPNTASGPKKSTSGRKVRSVT